MTLNFVKVGQPPSRKPCGTMAVLLAVPYLKESPCCVSFYSKGMIKHARDAHGIDFV